LKNIYDLSNIKIIFSGSSKIKLETISYDFSRRVVIKYLPIFSYLEYLNIKHNINIKGFSLSELFKNYKELSFQYSKYYSKDVWKNEYLEY
jgi:predicted AAA+ superfamily ATPase